MRLPLHPQLPMPKDQQNATVVLFSSRKFQGVITAVPIKPNKWSHHNPGQRNGLFRKTKTYLLLTASNIVPVFYQDTSFGFFFLSLITQITLFAQQGLHSHYLRIPV